jgi:OOP family OmpA-OmpF porin
VARISPVEPIGYIWSDAMIKSLRLPALALLLAFSYSSVLADAQTGQKYFTAMASYSDGDVDRLVDDGVTGGEIGMGWAFHDSWNIEGYAGFFSLDGPAAQEHIDVGAKLQLVFGRQNRLTPYLFVGASYLEVNPDAAATESGAAFSAGAGLMLDLFGDSPAALRAEYRYRSDDLLDTRLNDQFLSLGLQFPFGGAKPAAVAAVVADPDSDGDGVADSRDRCPGTPAGASVDASGCPLDSDGDGVVDHNDNCPGTMRGVTVDTRGCEPDTDRDGVLDRNDRCPGTAAGVQVDVNGCEIKEEIQLPGVNFESNSDRLMPGAEVVLREAAESLKRNPTIKVEVAGHTDSDGDVDYNEGLSARRAATVRDYLIAQGVSPARMTSRGYGELQPIADNSTSEGKARNRRVVLRITER